MQEAAQEHQNTKHNIIKVRLFTPGIIGYGSNNQDKILFRTPVLKKMAAVLKNAPVVMMPDKNSHPRDGMHFSEDVVNNIAGTITQTWMQDGCVMGELAIDSQEALRVVLSKEVPNVSIGFQVSNAIPATGDKLYNKIPYNRECIDIHETEYLHVALVKDPRITDADILQNAAIASHKQNNIITVSCDILKNSFFDDKMNKEQEKVDINQTPETKQHTNEGLVAKAIDTLGNLCSSLVQNNILRNSKEDVKEEKQNSNDKASKNEEEKKSNSKDEDNETKANTNDKILVGGKEYEEDYLKNAIEAFEKNKDNTKKNADSKNSQENNSEDFEKSDSKSNSNTDLKDTKDNNDVEDDTKQNTLRNSFNEVSDKTSYQFSKNQGNGYKGGYGNSLSADLRRGADFYND